VCKEHKTSVTQYSGDCIQVGYSTSARCYHLVVYQSGCFSVPESTINEKTVSKGFDGLVGTTGKQIS